MDNLSLFGVDRRQLKIDLMWYPGHIAKTEKEVKNQLKLMDTLIDVRDARIPMSTSHPHAPKAIRSLNLTKMAPEQYLSEAAVRSIADNLTTSGHHLNDEDLLMYILGGVGSE
ncbi:Uncharacterized protein Fot_07509 [Forsythia ovata]|uniref:Uncharacterized protein n=1 Tax=Forsythia ovata TaxID=205694 RepID=A0ABD1WW09_9LAMI